MARGTSHVARAVAIAALCVASVQGQQPAFRFERPVSTAASGAQRLAIDVPLLAGGAPFAIGGSRARPVAAGGLSDLRFFDSSGTEVQYLLVSSPPVEPDWLRAAILPIAATDKTSGFEADFGEALAMDRLRVGGLPAPFLKRLVLEGSGDRRHWTLLAGEGTLFDLPDDELRQTELPFAPGTYRYLRVTWNDTNSGRVPLPRWVEARRVGRLAAPPALTAGLTIEQRPSEPGRSRYRIRLPGARLPIVAIELQVDGGHVFRGATVYQSRLTGNEAVPAQIGRAQLRRVVRENAAAASLRIPVAGVTESELDLVIEDGVNRPLAIRGATAIFAELPWIYFETSAAALTARYGNASLPGPTYDLEAVRERVVVSALPEARWGEPHGSSASATAPTMSPLPEAGAAIESAGFRHVRAVPDGEPQLVALAIDAAALAHSAGPAGAFGDVRILDGQNRQVPYLLERRDEPLVVELRLVAATAPVAGLQPAPGRHRSTYAIELPYASLPAARVVIETSARVFRRTVQLGVERPPDRHRRERWFQVLASEVWTHANQQDAAPALTLPLRDTTSRTLLVHVDEGDNQPLPITAARLLLPSYRLRFYRPAGAQLRLAYGRDDLVPPRYDLALLAPQVMGVNAREIAAGPETDTSGDAPASFIAPRTFWLLLGVAAVALLALIVRLTARVAIDPDRSGASSDPRTGNGSAGGS